MVQFYINMINSNFITILHIKYIHHLFPINLMNVKNNNELRYHVQMHNQH